MIYLYIPHPLASSWRPPPNSFRRSCAQTSSRATSSLRRHPACSLASTPGKRKLICANNGLDESDKHLPDKAHLGQPPSWLHGRIHCQCTEGTKKRRTASWSTRWRTKSCWAVELEPAHMCGQAPCATAISFIHKQAQALMNMKLCKAQALTCTSQ